MFNQLSLGPTQHNSSILNNIINRNEELNKLRANIKGLGERLNTNVSLLKQGPNQPMSAFVSKNSQFSDNIKDFTFQPLKEKTNMNGKPTANN